MSYYRDATSNGTEKSCRRLPARNTKLYVVACLILAMVLAASSCTPGASGGDGKRNMTIGYQFGVSYAPLLVVKHEKWLERALPDVNVDWRNLNSGAAIRDGMVANEIHVGSGGIGPFLIGWASELEWKIVAALGYLEYGLMTTDTAIKSLRDFGPNHRIGVPGPDSIQAIVLRKAAQDQLGDAHALDRNLVSLSHPEAQQALVSGQLAAHFAAPPFTEQEEAEGARAIVRSFDVFGQHTGNSVFVRQGFHDENPELMQALVDAIDRAIKLIKQEPDRAAQILSDESDGQATPEQLVTQFDAEGLEFSPVPSGFARFAAFMKEIGLIDKAPAAWTDLVYDNLKSVDGS